MMKLKSNYSKQWNDQKLLTKENGSLLRYAWPNTEISVDCIEGGPESIESDYDEVLACPYVVQLKRKKTDLTD